MPEREAWLTYEVKRPMGLKLKPVHEQVIVITGASSGIGLTTALSAAEQGASVVLCGRSTDTLERVAQEIGQAGGQALAVTADVGVRAQLQAVAEQAIARFGRIDTWINDAGIGMYGLLEEVSEEDARRLFDTNFWGIVNGSLAALPHLKQGGGALINLGSEVSDAYMPLMGMYAASKHAVKGFTDTLRVELENEDAPVSVTLIEPTAVNTPFPQHARNYMKEQAKLPPPMLDPQKVADAILHAAQSPKRELTVGLMANLNVTTTKLLPALADKITLMRTSQLKADRRAVNPQGALYQASESGETHGNRDGT